MRIDARAFAFAWSEHLGGRLEIGALLLYLLWLERLDHRAGADEHKIKRAELATRGRMSARDVARHLAALRAIGIAWETAEAVEMLPRLEASPVRGTRHEAVAAALSAFAVIWVPRPLLVALAQRKHRSAGDVAAAIAHCHQHLRYKPKTRGFYPTGRCAPGWIARAFGVAERTVRRGERTIEALGWLVNRTEERREAARRTKCDRWFLKTSRLIGKDRGGCYTINLDWLPPPVENSPVAGSSGAAARQEMAAPPHGPLQEMAASDHYQTPLRGDHYQTPARQRRRTWLGEPRWDRIGAEDLRDPERLEELRRQAIELGFPRSAPGFFDSELGRRVFRVFAHRALTMTRADRRGKKNHGAYFRGCCEGDFKMPSDVEMRAVRYDGHEEAELGRGEAREKQRWSEPLRRRTRTEPSHVGGTIQRVLAQHTPPHAAGLANLSTLGSAEALSQDVPNGKDESAAAPGELPDGALNRVLRLAETNARRAMAWEREPLRAIHAAPLTFTAGEHRSRASRHATAGAAERADTFSSSEDERIREAMAALGMCRGHVAGMKSAPRHLAQVPDSATGDEASPTPLDLDAVAPAPRPARSRQHRGRLSRAVTRRRTAEAAINPKTRPISKPQEARARLGTTLGMASRLRAALAAPGADLWTFGLTPSLEVEQRAAGGVRFVFASQRVLTPCAYRPPPGGWVFEGIHSSAGIVPVNRATNALLAGRLFVPTLFRATFLGGVVPAIAPPEHPPPEPFRWTFTNTVLPDGVRFPALRSPAWCLTPEQWTAVGLGWAHNVGDKKRIYAAATFRDVGAGTPGTRSETR